MKNKSKSKIVLRSVSDFNEINFENHTKKQIRFSFNKHLDFLQKRNKLFSKPLYYNSGDADTYFCNILRNYDNSDLFQNYTLNNRQILLKNSKSFERLPKNLKPKKLLSLVELKTKPIKSNSKLKIPRKKEYDLEILQLKKPPVFLLADQIKTDSIKSTIVLRDEYELNTQNNNLDKNKDIESKLVGKAKRKLLRIKMAEEDIDLPDINDIDEEEISDMEEMIAVAEEKMNQMDEENIELLNQIDRKKITGSTFKFNPKINVTILKELEDAEEQANKIACIIYELKNRINELLQKEKMSETEAKELEQKNNELKTQMTLFEEETKRIQKIIEQSNLFEKITIPQPPRQIKYAEDILPKVIICGVAENDMPKILVCNDKVKKLKCSSNQMMVPQIARKLTKSYVMQQKLASENVDSESIRYQVQSDLLNKEQTVDQLQRNIESLQAEMRMICKENACLNERIQQICQVEMNMYEHEQLAKQQLQSQPPCLLQQSNQWGESQKGSDGCNTSLSGKSKKRCCAKIKTCPIKLENKLNEYNITTLQLEKQITTIENEVNNMQNDVMEVQKVREHLDKHRQMLFLISQSFCCPPSSCTCAVPLPYAPKHSCYSFYNTNRSLGSNQQVKEMREKYNRLQDDFKNKLTEVAGLRTDNEILKETSKKAEAVKKFAEEKMKELEKEMKIMKMDQNIGIDSKEQLIEQEQQLIVAKQRFMEAQDELEELRGFIEDLQAQLGDYRDKYLKSQQAVEEHKRQIDLMEIENNRVSEQVNLEIQRVKNQFQEKLQELTPLPDILKATQIKLQDVQQMHILAERNNEALERDLKMYKEKVEMIKNQMEQARSSQQLGEDNKQSLNEKIEEWQEKFNKLQEEHYKLLNSHEDLEKIANEKEKCNQEKLHEITQLSSQLESVRDESARKVSRTKDRCETIRRSMQNQITDLERDLVQSRTHANATQKDRDDLRLKMQIQINNLNENFEDAQLRIRSLQEHVNFLKNSYNNIALSTTGGSKGVYTNM